MPHIARINSIRPAVTTHRGQFGATALLNVGLAIAALMLLMYYVMQVNVFAASNWRLRDARERLGAVKEERSMLVARQTQMDDRASLNDIALAQGMEPAGAVVYLVEPDAVAAAH